MEAWAVMKGLFGRLVAIFVLALMGYGAWSYRHHVANALAARSTPVIEQPPPKYAEVREAQHVVELQGPLADYMARERTAKGNTAQPDETQANATTATTSKGPAPTAPASTPPAIAPVSLRDDASGPPPESPVGTSSEILHKTFRVTGTMSLPFEVPARATNPQLRGTYSASASQGADASVEFLVLNEKQFTDFLEGHGGEAVFSADDAQAQEANVSLPPTYDQPAKYYLVFRDNAKAAGKKVVKADFRIDF
jgi:hypothetical protein